MIKFGPSGSDELFLEECGGDFEKMPEWADGLKAILK